MIVFAGLVPHPPLSIPEVGKENTKLLEQTEKALQQFEQELYATTPEVLVLIGRHGEIQEHNFSINQSPDLKVDFKDFGDLLTTLKFNNDIGLGYKIKEAAETKLPMVLTSADKLDYAMGVPLYHLTKHLPEIKVIPIGYSNLDNKQHLEFGHHIHRMIDQSATRVAIIACADLSPKLQKDSPAGFSPQGQEFDQKLIEFIQNKDIEKISGLDHNLVEQAAGQEALRSLLVLFGVIKDLNYKPNKLSYQSPFGIGYLVINFES